MTYIHIWIIIGICRFTTSRNNRRRFDRFVSAVISCTICSPGDCRSQEGQKSCWFLYASRGNFGCCYWVGVIWCMLVWYCAAYDFFLRIQTSLQSRIDGFKFQYVFNSPMQQDCTGSLGSAFPTGWVPTTSYKWSYKPFKWPCTWVTMFYSTPK